MWEEQGFKFDDGLEIVIYKLLYEQGWLKYSRQHARANINWVREFYVHNATGENTVVNVRGKLVPTDAAAINTILDLQDDDTSIYNLIAMLEEEDFNTIKNQLCLPGTEWNVGGKNPHTVSRPNLLPKAKLWNTFVKRNLMSTSHNQTVDRRQLVLINAILTGTKFNVGEVIAHELLEACRSDKAILAFPCLISALCRRAAVPTRPSDKYFRFQSGWAKQDYMRKMDLTDSIPIQIAMPTPVASKQAQDSA
ncbi:hypothetical protein V6N13_108145 [Hibiscus sabdariffa]